MKKRRPRGRPRQFADGSTDVTIRFGNRLLAEVQKVFHSRQLPSRADTIRALVAEALGMKQ